MDDQFSLSRNDIAELVLSRPGEEDVKDVRLRRAFPWSLPNRYISIRSVEGKEILLIDDLNHLAPDLSGLIRDWLNENCFIPRITRIDEVNLDFGYQQWTVLTDCGRRCFRVQEREDIRFLNDGRFSVKDADGNVYELPNIEKLDEHSRKQMESLI